MGWGQRSNSFWVCLWVIWNIGMDENEVVMCDQKALFYNRKFGMNMKFQRDVMYPSVESTIQGSLLLTWFNFNPSMDK